MSLTELFTRPETRMTLAGGILAAIGGTPLGVFLVLRRMSLIGDVMAHAILPGVAAGFIVSGFSIPVMGFGGLIAGLIVALLSGLVSRITLLREDASLAGFYLAAVALGVAMISRHGSSQDLEDILFGDPAAIDLLALKGLMIVSSITLVVLSIIYRPLVTESFDPVFMRVMRGQGALYQGLFIVLVVLNMIACYRVMGTLMAAGIMLIPAITAQFWSRHLPSMLAVAMITGIAGAVAGLIAASVYAIPSGPAIVLCLSAGYIFSICVGRYGSLRATYFPFRHLER